MSTWDNSSSDEDPIPDAWDDEGLGGAPSSSKSKKSTPSSWEDDEGLGGAPSSSASSSSSTKKAPSAWDDSESDSDSGPAKPAATASKSSAWDDSDDDVGQSKPAASSSSGVGGGGLWSDEEEAARDAKLIKGWDDSSEDDVKATWDADSDEERRRKQAGEEEKHQQGVAAKPKKVISAKKKKTLFLKAQKNAQPAEVEDPDEDPNERKKRLAEMQQQAERAVAEDLFGLNSDDDESNEDLDGSSGDEIDRSATTEDPSFMSGECNLDELGDIDGPKVKTLDLSKIRIRGREEIDNICRHISELLDPYKHNVPYTNILISLIRSLGEKIDPEAIQQTISNLNRLKNEKEARNRTLKGRKKPKRAEVKPITKAEATARAATSKRAKPVEFWYYLPTYKEDYETFGALIGTGLGTFSRSAHFPALIATLIRDLCTHLEPDEIRLIVIPLNRLATDRLEAQKPKKKAPTKATLVGAGKSSDFVYKKEVSEYDREDY